MTNNLRAARKAAGLEQEELAARSGISQGTISRIERGSPAPSVDTALALARALGTTVEHLFGAADPNTLADAALAATGT